MATEAYVIKGLDQLRLLRAREEALQRARQQGEIVTCPSISLDFARQLTEHAYVDELALLLEWIAAMMDGRGLDNVHIFDLRFNHLGASGVAALCPILVRLQNVKRLDLRANDMTPSGAAALVDLVKYPPTDEGRTAPLLTFLHQLEHLDFSDNGLGPIGMASLAPVLKTLTNLTCLRLGANSFGTEVMEQGVSQRITPKFEASKDVIVPLFWCLSELKSLDLQANDLSTIWLSHQGQCCNLGLESIVLCRNELRSLPPEIPRMAGLKHLDVSFNQISLLPPEVGLLTCLQYLDLRHNQLQALPVNRLLPLTRLSSLSCQGNPDLLCPPSEVSSRGGAAVMEFLRGPCSARACLCPRPERR